MFPTYLLKYVALGLVLVGLGACSGSTTSGPVKEYFNCREVYEPSRGRLYDRHGELLLATQAHYMLTLPHLAQLDTVAFNNLMGWPANALQERVAAARLPAGPPPHRPAPDGTATTPAPATRPPSLSA